MCFGGRPKPPPLPKAEPVDSVIEQTATTLAIGDDRTMGKPEEEKTGQRVTGGRMARAIAPRRLGTRSLQIPLLVNSTPAGNLNYL
tara:strand:- start:2972 stop:3229 length:258 start_codon:yes stop_codon:yes gene_type:complete